MRASYTRKKIGGFMYKLMFREDKYYANRAADVHREEGYRARVLPDPRKQGNYEVWRSVNKIKPKR